MLMQIADKLDDFGNEFTLKILIGERAADFVYVHHIFIVAVAAYGGLTVWHIRMKRKMIAVKEAVKHDL